MDQRHPRRPDRPRRHPFIAFPRRSAAQKLKIEDERCILLTLQDQTIRETFYERGRLHFSRLSPLANTSIGGIAQGFATEAIKLQQYLC